jgi:thiamine pyrophosphate-dependent acetolactate synthase large subunit-like protein
MSKTAADQIVELMIEVGIRRVYGLVGDSINPITDFLDDGLVACGSSADSDS